MAESDWEKQVRMKYEKHDLLIDEISEIDFLELKRLALKKFVEENKSEQVPLIVEAFMGYLTSKNFRIVKIEN